MLLSAVPQAAATDLLVQNPVSAPSHLVVALADVAQTSPTTASGAAASQSAGLYAGIELVSLSNAGGATFDGTSTEVAVTPKIEVQGSGNLSSASVAITSGYNAQEDQLSVAGASGVSGDLGVLKWSFDAKSGVITFSGAASLSVYAQALRQVVYRNAAVLDTRAPSEGTRELSVSAQAENADTQVASISSQLVVSLVSRSGTSGRFFHGSSWFDSQGIRQL